MKNLLFNLDNLAEGKAKRRTKEEQYIAYNKSYWRSWNSYVGKVTKVNIENLIGLSQPEIVAKYLHTLPEEYRDIEHLYNYLGISIVARDGTTVQYGWRRSYYWSHRETYYYFNKDNILVVKRAPKKKKKLGTKKERKKKYFADKQARKRERRLYKIEKEKKYQDLLSNLTFKRKEKEEKLNLQKIVSHGFDPITSFRPQYKSA